jgi:hypothetical protein
MRGGIVSKRGIGKILMVRLSVPQTLAAMVGYRRTEPAGRPCCMMTSAPLPGFDLDGLHRRSKLLPPRAGPEI